MSSTLEEPPIPLKHERVAAVLEREIRSGAMGRGARLPGEVALARRFKVSRNTVRAALARLGEEGLIATRTGKGSFVLFDGRPLDSRLGWAWALDAQGVSTTVRVERLAIERDEALAERFDLVSAEVVVVERTWILQSGEVTCYEKSRVPAVSSLRQLPDRGLVDGSLTASLRLAGLVCSHGTQRIRARAIDEREASMFARRSGEWFLEISRTSFDAADGFVEHVEGLFDPVHFEVGVEFADER